MAPSKSSEKALGAANKLKRQELFIQHKKAASKEKREERFRMKKREAQDVALRAARLAKNKPVTLEQKRVWDGGDDDSLGARTDLAKLRRRRLAQAEESERQAERESDTEMQDVKADEEEDDNDSMLDSDDDDDDDDGAGDKEEVQNAQSQQTRSEQDDGVTPVSVATDLDLAPESLALKFASLFTDQPPAEPKVLVTTSLNSTIHDDAQLISTLFPNATYIRRSAHRYGHKYSLREICKFAANRDYSAVLLVREDLKQPTGLSIVHLPAGPTFHFSITNWIQGRKLPGHGNPTNHYPELLLTNFKTPLGLLTAKLFQTLYPPQPEIQGRQVVTLHNQRDYIFVRRHRYVFREKRATEKSIVDADGKEVKGVEGIRAGLQELGPRFTLKLRRVDKGIGRAGSHGDDATQWEWKSRMEKDRKVFNL